MTPSAHSRLHHRVAVIGAGASGLVSTKFLKNDGFSTVCFEMGDKVGGLWTIDNKNDRGGAYRSLHINTSTKKSEFRDFPMPTDSGAFPSHEVVSTYFSKYAERFELLSSIRFGTEVRKCTPVRGGYRLECFDRATGTMTSEEFGAVVVANGHHWDPAFPSPLAAAAFTGESLHSSKYVDPRTPLNFSNQRVLVVGIGNSAVDIACEICERGAARSVSLSCRRGAWVLPKYIFGKPVDQGTFFPRHLPPKFRRWLVTRSFKWLFGSMGSYGLPEPDHLIGEAHPTISSEFPTFVRAGKITMRPAISSAQQRRIEFVDGTHEEFDVIVYCTGYKVSFPFFSEDHISVKENRLPLFHRVFHPDHRRVFFVGLAQPLGGIVPVAESQAELIALHLRGLYNLPTPEEMMRRMLREEQDLRSRFVSSPRHTMQLDPHAFELALRKDLREGKTRAERGQGVPFPTNG